MLSNVHTSATYASHHCGHLWTSWAAVIAGVTTAIAVQIGLTALCLASGLALFEPAEANTATAELAIGTAIALLICALISVFLGGWVAGRMKYHYSRVEAAVHGMLVWAVASIGTLLLTTLSIGILAGGAFSLLSQGISGAAKGVGAALPNAVEAVAPSWETIKEEVTSAIEERGDSSETAASDTRFADRSRLMQLLGKSFTTGGQGLNEAERNELTKLVSTQLGISPEAARQTYDQWQQAWKEGLARFETAKEEAVQMAREAADTAATRLAQAAFFAFLTMILSLGAALAGAIWGRTQALECISSRPVVDDPHRVS